MEKEINSCLYCGNKPVLVKNDDGYFMLVCWCGVRVQFWSETILGAIDDWNKKYF